MLAWLCPSRLLLKRQHLLHGLYSSQGMLPPGWRTARQPASGALASANFSRTAAGRPQRPQPGTGPRQKQAPAPASSQDRVPQPAQQRQPGAHTATTSPLGPTEHPQSRGDPQSSPPAGSRLRHLPTPAASQQQTLSASTPGHQQPVPSGGPGSRFEQYRAQLERVRSGSAASTSQPGSSRPEGRSADQPGPQEPQPSASAASVRQAYGSRSQHPDVPQTPQLKASRQPGQRVQQQRQPPSAPKPNWPPVHDSQQQQQLGNRLSQKTEAQQEPAAASAPYADHSGSSAVAAQVVPQVAQKLRAPASWGSRSLPFSSSQHPDRQLAQQRQQRTEGIRAQSESGPPPTWMLPQFQPRPSTGQSARLQPSAQAQQPEQLDLPAQPVVHKSMLASASKRSHNGAIKLPSSQGPASQPIECGMTGTAEGHHLSDPEHDKEPTVAEKLLSMGFEPYSFEVGMQQNGLECPRCSGGDSGERSLSLCIQTQHSAAWHCFRANKCGYEGTVSSGTPLDDLDAPSVSGAEAGNSRPARARRRDTQPSEPRLEPLGPDLAAYLRGRGIDDVTQARNGVMQEMRYSAKAGGNVSWLAFVYRRQGQLVNVKYRSMNKEFIQMKGMEAQLYGLDDVVGQSEIIFVEGEMDKLSLNTAGLLNVVSVPNGAPSKSKLRDGSFDRERDTAYRYLWNSQEIWSQAKRFVLATDGDTAGDTLARQLAMRLGVSKCRRASFTLHPGQAADCKDANEMLVKHGAVELRKAIARAQPMTLEE